MNRAEFSPLAEQDLEEIVEFIARENPTAALSLLATIREKCTTLASHPKLGRHRPGFKDSEIRSIPVGNYIIFYRPTAVGVEIARVIHGARDLESLH
jgi:toxin ParE1/3/4